MTRLLRVVFHGLHDGSEVHDGATNLATDEALLDAGSLDAGFSDACWLRFYRWSEPTISLGYFQRFADFDDCGSVPVVRRCTGGGAIWHEHELTFAYVGPLDVLPTKVEASYAEWNEVLTHAAARFDRVLRPATPAGSASRWCFEQSVGLDLVDASGRKTVGSAQRRRDGRFLHHGSIVLTAPAGQTFCGAMNLGALELAVAIVDSLVTLRHFDVQHVDLPDEVRERRADLVRTRYGQATWNTQR